MADPTEYKYIVFVPGYWAVDKELKHAVAYLLSTYSSGQDKDLKLDVFHVTDDWEFDGNGVRATKVERLPQLVIKHNLVNRTRRVMDEIEDLTDDVVIKHEEAKEHEQSSPAT